MQQNKEYGFVGNKVRDLATLRALNLPDEKRPVSFGLTNRMVESGIRVRLQELKTGNILEEFFETSKMSLTERMSKENINIFLTQILKEESGGTLPNDESQLAKFDEPAYLLASFMYRLETQKEIQASEVNSESFALIIKELLKRYEGFCKGIGANLALSGKPEIIERVQVLGICSEEDLINLKVRIKTSDF